MPASAGSSAAALSCSSTSQPPSRPAPKWAATAAALVGTPIAVRQASAMPRTGAPPMIGDTPTTVLALTASLMPGTVRIGPMLTTGLDGGNSTTSAAAIASSTPGAGVASAAPDGTIETAGTSACSRSHHSWKCTVRRAPSSSMTTCVSTRSSDMGSSRTPGRHRRHSAAVISDSGWPSASIRVRTMWVAMSLSPRVNQSGPAPYAASSRCTVKDSSSRPQPCCSLIPPPSVYITVSRSGQIRNPDRVISSPVLPMTVISASRAAVWRPRRNRAAPTPPANTVMRMADSLAGPASGRDSACHGDRAGQLWLAASRHAKLQGVFQVIRGEAQRVREPAALLLLAGMALSLIGGVWVLLSSQNQLLDAINFGLSNNGNVGSGLNFGDRGLQAFGYFGAVYVTALPVLAVLLVTLAGERTARAKEITFGAAALQAIA